MSVREAMTDDPPGEEDSSLLHPGFAEKWHQVDWIHGDDSIEYQDYFEDLALNKVQDVSSLWETTKENIHKYKASKFKQQTWIMRYQATTELQKKWCEITPIEFVQVLELIGSEDAIAYLNALSLIIKPDKWNMMDLMRAKKQPSGKAVHFSFVNLPKNVGVDSVPMDEWLPDDIGCLASKEKNFNPLTVCMRNSKAEFRFNWTTTWHLFTTNPEDQVYMIKALADLGSESGVFNTVVGHGLMNLAWKTVRRHYWFERVMGFFFLLVLMVISVEFRRGHAPPVLMAIFALLLAIRGAGLPFIELLMAGQMYGCQGLTKFLTVYNILLFVSEMSTGIATIVIIVQTWGGGDCTTDDCYLYRHPVLFMWVIAARWFEFCLAMLCTSYLGENVLPAFHAVTSREAGAYIVFLFMVYMMVLQAYLALPIGENWDDLGADDTKFANNYFAIPWIAALKIYRMLFLGDFDIFELSGANQTLEATLGGNGSSIEGSVDDNDISDKYNIGVKLGFVFGTVAITIMFMNVGIGLLSNLYDEAKSKKHQICAHYKADYAVKLLLWRHFFPGPCFALGCDTKYNAMAQGRGGSTEGMGIWIVNDKMALKDVEDETFKLVEKLLEQNELIMEHLNIAKPPS